MSWLPLLVLIWPAWLSRTPEQLSPIWRRRSLIVLIGFFTLRYLLWRVSASLNLSTPLSTTLSLLLLAAEAWLLLSGMVPLLLAWRRFPDRRPAMHQLREQWRQSPWTPTVDILVPTFGEPINVLERTLIGCCNQTYPHTRVWVLDDSGRREVKSLASRQGCTYVHRPVRTSAKAGNLNHGLRRCRGELVAVFDADFIPQTTFLENSIGFLLDPKVGLLQTPQTFINADPVMRNLGMERWLLSDEESFYRWIEPVRDGWGAVVCAGTAFLARRSALDSVGGFVEKAISEDFVTGINLRRKGWSLLYLQQKLSAGLAAETMADFVRQRQRWASGTLQSLRLPEGPLRGAGLTPWQRVAYLEGVVHWVNNLPRLVLMLMPLSYGLLGTVPILITADDAVRLLLPLWATLLMGVGWLNRGSRTAFLSELTGWVLTVPLTVTVLANLMGRIGGFRVTPKHQRRDRGSWSLQLSLPLLALLALNLFNLNGLLKPQSALDSAAFDGRPLGLLWAVLNLLSLVIALRACWDPPSQDPSPWQAIETSAWLQDDGGHRYACTLKAISESGAELQLHEETTPLVASTSLGWCKEVPPLPVQLEMARGQRLAVCWGPLNAVEHKQLIRWLFCRPNCWRDRMAPPEWKALGALLTRLFTAPSRRPFQRCLMQQAEVNASGSRAG
ncbi:putative polysaccharide-forming beta-glycosyltransferase/ family 2 [Synechococcus sp. MEDNS5]|uniref:glycosyltransferase family 2 protein n=1 Tax=Synechococcus sp. MEDNS5 TaxID=1442554 RepID=UPI0016476E54|nr:cellulose synthase catalytic subunit [Synechococcus sp. MEDNS5]QNJ05324.1 putative polysaccharide-forming beta-glycosyltransferase/ family 2 [Synechococcus sp. MEDNS5]